MISPWDIKWVEVPITVTAGAYSANDVVGGTLSCAVGQRRGGCFIYGLHLVDDATQAAAYTLYVFDSAPSAIADNAAHVPTEADWLKCKGKIAIAAGDYDTAGTEADSAWVYGVGSSAAGSFVHLGKLDSDLYFRLVCTATPTFTDVNDLTLYVALYVP